MKKVSSCSRFPFGEKKVFYIFIVENRKCIFIIFLVNCKFLRGFVYFLFIFTLAFFVKKWCKIDLEKKKKIAHFDILFCYLLLIVWFIILLYVWIFFFIFFPTICKNYFVICNRRNVFSFYLLCRILNFLENSSFNYVSLQKSEKEFSKSLRKTSFYRGFRRCCCVNASVKNLLGVELLFCSSWSRYSFYLFISLVLFFVFLFSECRFIPLAGTLHKL